MTKYGYDGAGNRVSLQKGGGPVVHTTYDDAGLPVSSTDGTTFEFDAAGNLTEITKGQATTYDYDPWSRMTEAATPAGTLSYAYDALDRTTTRVAPASTTTFAYTGLDDDPSQISEGGASTEIAYGPFWPPGAADRAPDQLPAHQPPRRHRRHRRQCRGVFDPNLLTVGRGPGRHR